MSYRPTVSMGDFDFPEPSEYNVTTATLVDSARNAQGVVVGGVVRNEVMKIELKYEFLLPEQWSSILKKFSERYGGQFYNNITFLDPISGNWNTLKMYPSDRKAGVFLRDPISGRVKGYRGASLSLVEV